MEFTPLLSETIYKQIRWFARNDIRLWPGGDVEKLQLMDETTVLLFTLKLASQAYDKYYNGDLAYCIAG